MVPRGVLGRVGAALLVMAVCVSAEMLPEVMYSAAVPHDVTPAHIVHKIKLKDGQTVTKLMDSEYSDYFAALDNGEVMTVSRLTPLLGRVATLRVATKYANGDTQVYAIRVAIKDHQTMLRFLKPEYDASVYENLPAGTELQGLDDLEAMGEEDVRYELLGGHSVFALHHVGGIPTVVTRQALDREAQDLYRLVLRAYDKEGMDTAEAKINVHILDMNDHAPVFTQSMFYFFVPLNISRFDKLGRVTAHDGDGDKVVYRLAYPSNIFTIVPQTGEIMVIEPPETMVYELELEAFDKRKPTLYSDVLAKAHIEFRSPSDSLFTGESNDIEYDAYPEHIVSKRSAKKRVKRGQLRHTKEMVFSEADGAVEKKVVFQLEKEIQWETFKIRDDNPWVEVDSNGAVRVKKKWDYEELGPEKTIDFWVTITNNDRNGELSVQGGANGGGGGGDGVSYKDNQRVILQITDVNDEPPYFINRPLPMQAVVKLNAAPNTPVFTLQARDPDKDHDIHYFLVRDRTGGRFEVDEKSGVVRTRGSEMFQLDMEYVLYVKAEDQNGRIDDKHFQSTPEERLSIVGGKRPPQFYLPKYEKTIPENTAKDADIISVKAKSFADREIRYTLKAKGQGAGTFNIGPNSGIVKLAKELDFEDVRQPHIYQLVVTATEDSGGFSTSVDLTIKVTDVNDNPPKFDLPDYQAHNIDEDIPIGSSILRVKARDDDSGTNAEITYSVSDDHYRVDNKGIIYNRKTLDADDNNAYYEFTVTATDRGEPAKEGTATIRIYTKNKNDEEPNFSQQVYTPNVDENAGPNTLVTTVVASDKDGDNVEFGFVGGARKSGQFVIEKMTGVIRLHNGAISLDRDKYELNVTAVDDGNCCPGGQNSRHTSTAVVVVFITDVNDNKPMFKDCPTYHAKVEESAPNGSPVITVHATDEDKGVNGQVRYSIVQQPNQKGTKFTVDPETGAVTTNKVFDREGEDGKFVSVTVKATDNGDPSLEGVCSFTVEITDINDNPPLFDRQKYIENVKQDTNVGTNILRVSASDEDADNNGAIVYNLTAASNPGDLEYFEVQPESGWIILKKPLDRGEYEVVVTAMDQGQPPLTSEVLVELNIVDRANRPPVWDEKVYQTKKIPENISVGQTVYSIKASSGIKDNPVVFYRIIRGSTAQTNKHDTFYLQQRPDNGDTWADIKVNHPLDYESIKEYNLTVRVENNGPQQLASEATIYVVLEDVNDEIPLFTEREQETVLEGEPIGTKVTQVNAIDKDGTYPNNEVLYRIVDSPRNEGRDFYEIRERTGEIFTRVEFDREEKQAYALEVEARDGAASARPNANGRPNTVTKFIRIGIADKNDNPPFFDKTLYEAEVDENEDIQHTVLTVTAKDLDESSRIRYEITNGNIGGAFAVKNMTGAIYVAGSLDYETRKRYELTLVATDSVNEATTKVVILIADVNDRPPEFDRPTYEATIEEERGDGLPIPIIKVVATDGDRDREQDIVYFLTGQGIYVENPDQSQFEVNRTSGEIFVRKPLDRDHPKGRPQWRFTVFAQDEGGSGLVGYADVQVNLKDINDNAPTFPQMVYFGNVTENGTQGMVVMTMTAEDYDDANEGSNAKLTYSIEKNVIDENTATPIFEIEPDTGVIKTAVCCLDREKTPDYSIQVVAVDGGGLKGTGTASIRVRDINDMPPRFTKEEWQTEVAETEGAILPDQAILTVTVHDEDETNKFHYKVIESSGYGADKFTMVRNNDGTGSLKIVQPLDYEDPMQRGGFRFKIQVNDKGEDNDAEKYHVAYSWVKVELRDINDNKPQFVKPNIEVPVFENAEIGKSLETFKATDPDQGGQSKVLYAIDRTSDRRRQFAIDGAGTVKIQRSLDREENPRHSVKILAIDDGTPAKTATATLTVIVQDINDNSPRFLKDYRPVLPENTSPRKIVEVLATDDDDRSKGNGPPFHFRMDSTASDEIRASFKVEHIPKGANGDGMAVISSLRTFDREVQKEYHVPIVIKDAGTPQMTGTSTLTIIIGDENDNKMQPGSKEIFVYNYKGQAPETPIGRVYVYDLDDWDLPDKKFNWAIEAHPNFKLNEDDGMITMKRGTGDGKYFLQFHVYDRKHTQTDVEANVTVTVKEIPEIAVINSGSIRIANMTAEDFIRIWNYKSQRVVRSKADIFREKIARLVGTKVENVDVFSIQLKQLRPPVTDIRFSAHGSPYYQPIKLDGLVLQHRADIEAEVGINITMVGIDECLYENVACEGSCTNHLVISSLPYMVNANKTALVGVRTEVVPECTCGARNFTQEESCRPNPCYNGGRCIEGKSGVHCRCPDGYDGPRCQMVTRTFRGNGFAWFPPFKMCDNSHISLEFLTRRPEGLLFYNGPITPPEPDEIIVSDFIALELENGRPRLLIDFGSGTLQLRVNTKVSLNDGKWHRIDIFWDTEIVRIDVDHCVAAEVQEPEDGGDPIFESSGCQATGSIPPFNEYLNVNAPLQVGGRAHEPPDPSLYKWSHVPHGKFFSGCIRNLMVNSELYDLARPGQHRNTQMGCPQLEEACRSNSIVPTCGPNGICSGSLSQPVCKCKPGWTGPTCDEPTNSSYFETQSYVKYALSFKPNSFSTEIQLRFRTWQEYGELFRISDQHNREYGILEIKDGRLRFRYNLNSLRTEEHDLWLSAVAVNDGIWHSVLVERHGSTSTLMLDGGEGRRYNETMAFSGHMLMDVDKQEGVYAGGKAEYTGIRTFEVYNDYKLGCLDDIRLEGKHLPLPPGLNGTQWGQATMFRNLVKNCISQNQCVNVTCIAPFTCKDLWMKHECGCPEGSVFSGSTCVDIDECELWQPCFNGVCINLEPEMGGYECQCVDDYHGTDCNMYLEETVLKPSTDFVVAIVCCIILLLLLVLVFVVYNRQKERHFPKADPYDDVRENIINYDDEGGGEDDMTAFDITPLQIPVGPAIGNGGPLLGKMPYGPGGQPDVGVFISEHKNKADNDPNAPPFDDLRNYAYEGGGSTAGSLSSLASGTDDNEQDFDYLNNWGPRFSKLADMYGHGESEEEEDH
ncbi:neural-cadherin-like isoform X1 [Portunus trituberculatus]|uniref:neural-cadherin-like isoform X1 n=1 Tax=Portunus trituberculatus TaxID=210409 RepID=UPI001E1CC6C2|nr:neural-cadherin-like isoform X1 [Portunus trituberculatus]XP_045127517.1 neural-cadherin-like isoform X1 [Portunus trituberculatus]